MKNKLVSHLPFQPNVVLRQGYLLQSYEVKTDDGYILTLYRIPHDNEDTDKKRQPVLLEQGFISKEPAFLYVGNKSLGKKETV